jgi:hypothetical protein
VLSVHAVRYRRERWTTPAGQTIVAPPPEGTNGHFGPNLRGFVLMQYHQGQTTLPRLTALLHSVGVAISEREIQRQLTAKQDGFLAENREVLHADRRRPVHLVRHALIQDPAELPGSLTRRAYRLRLERRGIRVPVQPRTGWPLDPLARVLARPSGRCRRDQFRQ